MRLAGKGALVSGASKTTPWRHVLLPVLRDASLPGVGMARGAPGGVEGVWR